MHALISWRASIQLRTPSSGRARARLLEKTRLLLDSCAKDAFGDSNGNGYTVRILLRSAA